MKRVFNKYLCGLSMAMAIFSIATCDVNVSAAGFFYQPSSTQTQQKAAPDKSKEKAPKEVTKTAPTKATEKAPTKATENAPKQFSEKVPEKTSGKTIGNKTYIEKEKETSTTSSYLTSKQQSVIDSLDTDYNKVKWDLQYSPKGMDGIIISVAPYSEGNYSYLLVAITNIYNQDVTFSATGSVKGRNGQEVADISIFENAICPGNTIAKSVYCDSTPTGEIYWEDIELPNVYEKSTYWEGDWSFSTDADGYYQINYSLTADDYMTPGYVTVLLLDDYGYIVDTAYNYNIDKGYSASGKIQFFQKEFSGEVSDVAMFVNPLQAK